MRHTTCPICKQKKAITGYHRDNPRLSCGHILTMKRQEKRDELKQDLYEALRNITYELMREEHLDYMQAQRTMLGK